MAGPGPAGPAAHLAVGGGDPGVGNAVPDRAGGGVEAIDRRGIRLRPLVNARQLLLLSRDRAACGSSGAGSPGADGLPLRPGLAAEGGVPADRGGRDGVVLAHAGRRVDPVAGGAGRRTVAHEFTREERLYHYFLKVRP